MGRHRTTSVRRAATLTGAALTAGALLLAGPAATALADLPPGGGSGGPNGPGGGGPPPGGGGPDDGGGVGGGNTALGVGNRPGLKNPAPVLTGIQTVGDQVIGNNPALSGNPFVGGTYDTLFGRAGRADDGDGIREPGEAYQGAYVGVLNGGFQTNRGSSGGGITCPEQATGVNCGEGGGNIGGGPGSE